MFEVQERVPKEVVEVDPSRGVSLETLREEVLAEIGDLVVGSML